MIDKKRIVAVVCGGYHGEYEVSLRSADGIISNLDSNLYEPYKVVIRSDRWYVLYEGKEFPIDKSDFSALLPGIGKLCFEYAYITIHGTPGEDGHMQGYFNLLGIPYSTGGTLCESLTFNKEVCNRYLSSFGFRISPSVCLQNLKEIGTTLPQIQELGLPVFVKPNVGGSSIATTKVTDFLQLEKAIRTAFEEGEEVLVEKFIPGTEVTCGCVSLPGKVEALPVTEVVTHSEFFDYDAKYNGLSDEITPARIAPGLYGEIQRATERIAHLVRAHGIIRVDFIIEPDGRPTLLEVNTTPGMTSASFIPQQVAAAGRSLTDIFTQIIESSFL